MAGAPWNNVSGNPTAGGPGYVGGKPFGTNQGTGATFSPVTGAFTGGGTMPELGVVQSDEVPVGREDPFAGIDESQAPEEVKPNQFVIAENFEGWSEPGTLRVRMGAAKLLLGTGVTLDLTHQGVCVCPTNLEDTNGYASIVTGYWDTATGPALNLDLDTARLHERREAGFVPAPSGTVSSSVGNIDLSFSGNTRYGSPEYLLYRVSPSGWPESPFGEPDTNSPDPAQYVQYWAYDGSEAVAFAVPGSEFGLDTEGQAAYVTVWAASLHGGLSEPARFKIEFHLS